MMFDSLVVENEHIEIDQADVNFIKDLIRGRPLLSHEPVEKVCLRLDNTNCVLSLILATRDSYSRLSPII